MGHPIARWYSTNGAQGKKPQDPQLLKALELFRTAGGKKTEERFKIAQEIFKLIVDEQFSIGTVGQSPATMGVRIVSRRMGNIPSRQINAQHCRTPVQLAPGDLLLQGVVENGRPPALVPDRGRGRGTPLRCRDAPVAS